MKKILFLSYFHILIAFSAHVNGGYLEEPLRPPQFEGMVRLRAEQVIFQGQGANVYFPPNWHKDQSFGENLFCITQDGLVQGYKQGIAQVVSGMIITCLYKIWTFLVGPTSEDLAQQQSERQKEMGNLLLLLRNNQQLRSECDQLPCTGVECIQEKIKLRKALDHEHASLLKKMAAARSKLQP